jgi:hypothetical protein
MSSSEIKFVPKGWGFEKWIVNCEEYCGKILYFVKGRKCSWHYHKLKYYDEDDIAYANEIVLNKGDKFHIYRGLRHQMIALEDTELFEFSTQHFDEDSYRVIQGD